MWVLTKKAWFSVVAYDPKKDPRVAAAAKKGTRLKPHVVSSQSHLLVRARVKKDLEQLTSVVPSLVIYEDEMADYRYRAVVSRKAFKVWTMQRIDQIDYDSHVKEEFRDGISETQGKEAGAERYTAAFAIWSAWNKLQPWRKYLGTSLGKYGSAYAGAGAWNEFDDGYTLGPAVKSHVKVTDIGDQHEWSGFRTSDEFDQELDAKVVGYEEAARALGMAPPKAFELDLHDLQIMLQESEVESGEAGKWYLDFTVRDLDSLSNDAFLLCQYLIELYGHGGEINPEIFDAAKLELFGPDDEPSPTDGDVASEIHSLPLGVDPTV